MDTEYRFEIYSYGHLVESRTTTDKEKAKYLYMWYYTRDDVGIKVYKDNELIPYSKTKTVLGIDSDYAFNFYKKHSPKL